MADTLPDRLNQVVHQFKIERYYPDFRALMGDAEIEVVAVCVPPQLHTEVALAALEAEKHVFIEKPLALSLDQCDALIARAAHASQKVMVGFNLRWHRLLRRAQQAIQQEIMGPVQAVRTTFCSGIRFRRTLPEWRNQPTRGGGAIMEIAIHHFDLLRFLLQSEIEQVFAMPTFSEAVIETVSIAARMANGVQVTALFSEGIGDNHEVEIYGPAGRLQVSCYRFDGLDFFPTSSYPGSIGSRLRRLRRSIAELPQGIASMRQGGDFMASYKAEWAHFSDCIQNNQPVASTLQDGRRALQVALAAAESADQGCPLKVAQARPELNAIRLESLT